MIPLSLHLFEIRVLARRYGDNGDDSHRHSGGAQRQTGPLDGEGNGRRISEVISEEGRGKREE